MWIEVGTIASPFCVKINVAMRLLYLKLLSLYYQEPTSSWFNSKRWLKAQVFSYIKSITFWNVGMCSKQLEPRFSPDSLLSSWCRSQFRICNPQLLELDSLSVLSMQRVKRCKWSHPKESVDLSVMLSSESYNYCYVWFEEEDFIIMIYTWNSSLINERYCPKLVFWAK